jgi:hypothetical protein
VDGSPEARQAHGRLVSLKFRRALERRLPAMEPQCQPNDGVPQPIAQQQRTATGQATAAEVEECVPEALHGLCSCKRPESGCSGARETTSRRFFDTHWHHQDQNPILLDEAGLYRE